MLAAITLIICPSALCTSSAHIEELHRLLHKIMETGTR